MSALSCQVFAEWLVLEQAQAHLQVKDSSPSHLHHNRLSIRPGFLQPPNDDRPTDLTHHRQLQYSAVLPAQRHDSVPGGHWRIIATGGGNRRHKTGKLGPATSEHEQLTATKTTSSAFPAHSTNKSATNTQINRLDPSKPFEYEFTTSIIARLLLIAFRRAFC